MERSERLAEEIFRSVAEHAAKTVVNEKKLAVGRNDGEKFPSNRQQGPGLLLGKFRDALGHQTLWHSPEQNKPPGSSAANWSRSDVPLRENDRARTEPCRATPEEEWFPE